MRAIYGIAGFLRAAEEILAQEHSLQLHGCSETFKALALCSLQQRGQKTVVLVPRQKDIAPWYQLLLANGFSTAAQLPSYSLWGRDHFIKHRQLQAQRLFALNQLSQGHASVVVATLQGLLQASLLGPKEFSSRRLSLRCGDEYDFDTLISSLTSLGYRETLTVEEAGTFAVHGGTLDVFSLAYRVPHRLEFLGDRLQSLRTFHLSDQRSLSQEETLEIIPASELLFSSENKSADTQLLYDELLRQKIPSNERGAIMDAFAQGRSFGGMDLLAPIWHRAEENALSFLAPETVFFMPQSLGFCEKECSEFLEEAAQAFQDDCALQRLSLGPRRHFVPSLEGALTRLGKFHRIECERPIAAVGSVSLVVPESRPLPSAAGEEAKDLFSWLERINSYVAEGDRVVVLAKNKGRLNLLRQQCREHGIQAALLAQPFALGSFLGAAHTAEVQLACGSLPDLYRDVESRTLYLPCEKIYGAVNQRRKSSSAKRLQSMLLSQQHLVSGDLVVHQHHGIGRYMAVEQLVVGNSTGDFIKIEYQKGDKIYLPVAHINLLQKYQSQAAGSGSSSLDLLRGTSWQNRKAKVKKAVKDIAQELLNLQAQRQTLKGYAYGAAGELYQQFCDDFPYAPTEDQQRAIADVEADLASNKVMDRMVIGDVGFGKTEVALRAAFRVMCEGFQVLVLVPTTILCFQHYETIRKRMNKYGLQCSFVNRYIATAEQKKRVQLFAEGKIDIIVGTHRLLSKDVKAKNLGLIIIDEEQKFGVEHKEKLKTMRLQADLLLLTATPIPRSLHMAMLGLREISLIATPPPDRLPVKTIVAHFSDALLRQTIAAEFARGGQVFFVHNRVEDIEQVCSHLLSLVPFAKIGCAHGQMHERQLEQVMLDFFEQKTTILVCTAIIEAGIDLPNVNTLIVNNADHFGLSQLYQLRGRVGRSDVQGYAYLLVKNEHIITAEGKKRLEVLQSYQDLGAGMQIANYDLEIRGAGNLLGGEQSGHVAAVGLEYYNQMLNDTIASLAGKQLREEIDSEVKIPICAFIPQSYMPREFDRLKTYRQLFAAENRGEIEEVFNGVVDQFGAPPVEICRLIHVASLKKSLQGIKASKLHYVGPGRYQLNFRPLAESEIAHIVGMVQQHPQAYSLASGFVVEIHLGKSSLLEEDQQLILLQQRVEQLQCK